MNDRQVAAAVTDLAALTAIHLESISILSKLNDPKAARRVMQIAAEASHRIAAHSSAPRRGLR